MKLSNETIYLSENDLLAIKSRATSIGIELSPNTTISGKGVYSTGDLYSVYCYTMATMEFLRGRGIMSQMISLQKDQKDIIQCDHRHSVQLDDGNFYCDSCKKDVKPILWDVLKK